MRKITILFLTLLMILAVPVPSFAEADDVLVEDTTLIEESSANRPSKSPVKDKVEERKAKMEQKRTEIKADLAARREEAKEKFEERRQEFQEKLGEIKDERKQAIVERTDERLSAMNESLTNRLLEHLSKIDEVLDRVATSAESYNDSTLDDAITVARASIETAQTAIEEQAGKEYIVSIGEEDELRTAVKAVVEQFRTDMKATADAVKEARDKTAEAARILGTMMNDTEMMEDAPAGDEAGG